MLGAQAVGDSSLERIVRRTVVQGNYARSLPQVLASLIASGSTTRRTDNFSAGGAMTMAIVSLDPDSVSETTRPRCEPDMIARATSGEVRARDVSV